MAARRRRDYRTKSGRWPVKEFIESLPDQDAVAVDQIGQAPTAPLGSPGEGFEIDAKGGRSQTSIAAGMKSSQSSVARLEGSAYDARLSTIDRYAEALGFQVQWHLLPKDAAAAKPPVVVHGKTRP